MKYILGHEANGYYGTKILAEQDLMNKLIVEAVVGVVEFDKGEIERAVSTIQNQYQREMVQNYLDYLEQLVDSFELNSRQNFHESHDKTKRT